MSQLSNIEKKAGRLIVGRLPGTDLPGDFITSFKEGGLGGITLFRENCQGLEQLANLISEIYEVSEYSPVISVDQEGGAVQRFDRAIGSIPSAMVYAACPDRELIQSIFKRSCQQLKLLGVNILLAPVLDVLTNPVNPIVSTRSYGSIPGIVERNGSEMIRIIKEAGLVPVGKHFPGHGATQEDSHMALAISNVDTDRLWNIDLAPFKACLSELPAVLTGHLWIKCIDDEPLPASLSPRITTGILKDYLKFDGLVITDDLTMKGLTDSSSLADAVVPAVEAGNHLLLVCSNMEDCVMARESLVKAVESGRLKESMLDNAIGKIEQVLPPRPDREMLAPSSKKVFSLLKDLRQSVERDGLIAASTSAALLRGNTGSLEEEKEWIVLAPDHPRYDLGLAEHLNDICGSKYGDDAPVFKDVRYSLNPEFEENKRISAELAAKNCIYITFRCLLNEGQMQLGQMVADQSSRKIAVCPDTPFDYEGLPDWPCVIATYDPCDRAVKGLALALVDGSLSSKSASFFARLLEGVSVINRNRVVN